MDSEQNNNDQENIEIEQSENNGQNISCPNCKKKSSTDNKFCVNCGAKLTSKQAKFSKKQVAILISLISLIPILGYLASTGALQFQSDSGIFSNLLGKFKMPSCESEEVKSDVADIFEQNNLWYKDLEPDSISGIYLKYPAVSSYDKDIQKYSCTGTVVMTSKAEGFVPKNLEYNMNVIESIFLPEDQNVFFFKKYRGAYSTKDNIGYYQFNQYHTYLCPVEYTIQKSEGSILVKASYCTETESNYTLFGGYRESKVSGGEFKDVTIDNYSHWNIKKKKHEEYLAKQAEKERQDELEQQKQEKLRQEGIRLKERAVNAQQNGIEENLLRE